MHFAEILFTNPGQRIFDINVEGIKVKDNFDIVAKVGSFTATTEIVNSDVIDGVISINLNSETINGGVNNPKVSAIEIFALTPPVLASPIADFSAIKAELFTYSIPANTFLDAENDPLIFSASLSDGSPLPSWLSFDAASRTFSGTAPLNSPSILAIKVAATDGNSGSASDEFELKLSEPFSTVLFRINAGGPVTNTSIGSFSADQYFTTPSYTKSTNAAIAGTDDDNLYRSERWGLKTLNYNFPIASGKYRVILHFAEIHHTTTGKRVFDVSIEGNTVLNNFDIVAKAGAFTATKESFIVNVEDGMLSINLNSTAAVGGVDNPKIAAIEVLGLNTVNNPPVVAIPLSDQNAIEGTPFTFTIPSGTYTDPDNDPLTYSASLANGSTLPQWLSFNSSSNTFSGIPTADSPNTLVVKVTVGDGTDVVSDEFVININHKPIVPEYLYSGTDEESIFEYLIPINTFSDPDGDSLTLSVAGLSDPALSWLSFNSKTNTLSGLSPENLETEIKELIITVSDGKGGSATLSLLFSLTGYQEGPKQYAPFPKLYATTDEGLVFYFKLSDYFSDEEGDFISMDCFDPNFTWYGKIQDVDVKKDNQILTYRPPVGSPDSVVFDFEVASYDDSGVRLTIPVVIYIDHPTDPIVVLPLSDQNAVEGTPFTFTVPPGTFTDPNNDPLTYLATLSDGSALPQWLSFHATSNTFSGIPTADSPNTLMIEVTASDGNDSVSDEFEISINHLPVATSDGILILEGVPFNYTPFVDPDGDSLTISYTIYPQEEGGYFEMPRYLDWFKYNPATNSFFGAIPADFPYGDNYYFDVVALADDGKGGITQSSIYVNCELTNAPLILTKPFPNVNAVRGEYGGVIFDVNEYAQDPDAGFWRYNLGASFKMADGSAIPSWVRAEGYWQDEFVFEVLPPADAPDSLLFQITISDNWGDRVTSNFVLYISDAETNTSPVVTNPLIDQSAVEGTPFNFTIPSGTFTDPNNDPLTYSATLPNGSSLPQWLGFNSSSNTFSGIPPADSPNTLTVRVTASDGSDSVSDEFEININHLPVATSDGILILEGAPFNYTPFVDPDGDSLTISYIIYPQEEGGYYEMPRYLDWFKYNPATNSFFGAISADFPYGDNYYFDVVAIADDGKGGITQSSIYVNCELTNAPLILTKPFPNVNAVRGEYGGVIFDVNEYAQDPDAAFWRYNLGASFKMADGSAIPLWVRAEAHWQDEFIFEVLPPADAPDSLLFQVAISDNWGDRVTSNFVLYISDAETNTSNARMALKEKSGIDKVNATASPNPFTNILNIKVEGREDQEYQVKVNDLMGRELYTNTLPITEDLIAIDFSKIPNLPHSNLFLITVEDKTKTFRKVLRVIRN